MRTNFDFAPYRRSTVGFDRLFDLLENTARTDAAEGYPPFDIEQESEDRYCITIAVAGFRLGELDIVAHNRQLTVSGCKADEKQESHFLHRGIATRSFERRFQLADFVVVDEASLNNGLLRILLKRVVPDAMKSHRIEIGTGDISAAKDRLGASRNGQESA